MILYKKINNYSIIQDFLISYSIFNYNCKYLVINLKFNSFKNHLSFILVNSSLI